MKKLKTYYRYITIKWIGSLLVLAVLFSCETNLTDVDLARLPSLESKVVVTGFLSPQNDTTFISLALTQPLFATKKLDFLTEFDPISGDTLYFLQNSLNIPDAVVVLESSLSSVKLQYDRQKERYYVSRADFAIESGKNYSLNVNYNGKIVKANTTIPNEFVRIENVVTSPFNEIRTSLQRTDTLKGFKINFTFKDLPNTVNYYKLWGQLISPVERPFFDSDLKWKYKDDVTYNNLRFRDNNFDGSNRFLSDENKVNTEFKISNGSVVISPLTYCVGFGQDNCKTERIKTIFGNRLRLEVWNLSKELYDYEVSLRKANQSENNPFSEAVPVYSNIENGLGIFAGYNKAEYRSVLNF